MAQTTSTLSGVTINEIHMSPSGVSQDLNGDGVGDSSDEFIELHNTSGVSVDLNGWEIWESGNVKHTFGPGDTIDAGGYFTIVDNFGGTTNPIQNVSDKSDYSSDGTGLSFAPFDTYMLYDPNTGGFIVIRGDQEDPNDTTNFINMMTGFQRPGSFQVGSTEVLAPNTTGESGSRLPDGDTNWVSQTPSPGDPNCFLPGTMIATPGGEVAVEDLRAGDLVRTADGRDVPVLWAARQTVVKRFFGERAQPVRIAAGALGAGVPHSDLFLTGDHGMLLGGLLINAGALVDGAGIAWVPLAEVPERYTVHHIETEAHEAILANGAASESFIDYKGRKSFDNFSEYRSLYGDERVIDEMPLPRISAARLVPPQVRTRLGKGSEAA